jgi:hypothetical protein
LAKKEKFLKLLLPFGFLGIPLISPYLALMLGRWVGWQLGNLLFFLPQFVFLYVGFHRSDPFILAGNESNYPFGLTGFSMSLIHWSIVLLIYFFLSRKLNLTKSILLFCFLGFFSLLVAYFLLSDFGWNFQLDGP